MIHEKLVYGNWIYMHLLFRISQRDKVDTIHLINCRIIPSFQKKLLLKQHSFKANNLSFDTCQRICYENIHKT